MTVLQVNLGQVNTYDIVLNSTYTSNVKTVGLIINNQSKLDLPITLQNRPQNNYFNVTKIGNIIEYVLILSFEKM